MPDPKAKRTMSAPPSDDQQARIRRISQLAKQWGVPTNQILSQVTKGPKNIYTGYTPTMATQYYTFGPNGQVAQSITDRYEDTVRGYSAPVSPYQDVPVPITAQQKGVYPGVQYGMGGKMRNYDYGGDILRYAHIMEYGGTTPSYELQGPLDGVQHLGCIPANQIAKSGIHIKKENRGKFTAAAKRAGMGVQEYARHVLADPHASGTLKKRANFARNAAKWHHGEYGLEIPMEHMGIQPLDGIKHLEMAAYGYPDYSQGNFDWNDPTQAMPIDGTPPGMMPIDLSQARDQLGNYPGQGPQWEDQVSGTEQFGGPKAAQQIGRGMPNINFNAGPAIAGLAGIITKAAKRAQSTNEFARLKRHSLTLPTYNPIAYGTGSQAIAKGGTSIGGRSYTFTPDQVKFLRSQGYKI